MDGQPVRKLRRVLTMASLVLAGESIYSLPYYLRRDYAMVIVDATGISNTELGTLTSMLGVVALLCYFPGGWLADRFQARNMLVVSLVSTACGGLVLATLPGYSTMLALFAIWGITSILTFWGALIKATRAWGGNEEQGRAFGILDGSRGVVGALLASIALATFSSFDDATGGLRSVIWLYTASTLAVAVFCWFAMPAGDAPRAHAEKTITPKHDSGRVDENGLTAVLRMPVVWLQAVIILTAYAGYWGTFDVAQYAVEGYGQNDAQGAGYSVFCTWLRPFACIGAGVVADRLGASRTIAGAFVVITAAFASLALTPPTASTMWLLWLNTAAICAGAFALRGIYYALLEEGRVPLHLTGTAVGVVSIIGYLPDILIPPLLGWLLDTYPGGAGHRVFFTILAVGGIVGLSAAMLLRRRSRA